MKKINLLYSKIKSIAYKKDEEGGKKSRSKFNIIALVIVIMVIGIYSYSSFKLINIIKSKSNNGTNATQDEKKQASTFYNNNSIRAEVPNPRDVNPREVGDEPIVPSNPSNDVLAQDNLVIEEKEKKKEEGSKPVDLGLGAFSVIVSSCYLEKNANFVKDRLIKIGFSPIKRITHGNINMYRVDIGDEIVDKRYLERIKQALLPNGVISNIVLKGRDYKLDVEPIIKEETAKKVVDIIKRHGYSARVSKSMDRVPLFQISIGRLNSYEDAVKTREQLLKEGFSPFIKKG